MESGGHGVLLHKELEEAKLSAAFCELALEESCTDTGAFSAYCDAAHERILKRLRREYRRIVFGAAAKNVARQVSKAAVFLLITVVLAGGIAVAGSSLLRAKLYEIVVDFTNSHHNIKMYGRQIGEIELPDGWWAPFYHSYVPEGFEVVDEDVNPFRCYQYYECGEEAFWVAYDVVTMSTTIYTDGCDVSEIMIGDNVATLVTRDENSYTIFWHEGDVRISASLYLPYDEAIKIMENIVPIDIEEKETEE